MPDNEGIRVVNIQIPPDVAAAINLGRDSCTVIIDGNTIQCADKQTDHGCRDMRPGLNADKRRECFLRNRNLQPLFLVQRHGYSLKEACANQ